MKLISKIQELMDTDIENRSEQSDFLEKYYNESNVETKKQIDLCFIALCGYSLETLINEDN